MGYSNNKWRKILTILMIINLLFILFAKFSKVFGADTNTYNINNSDKTLDLSNLQRFYYYFVATYYPSERSYTWQYVICDKPFVISPNSSPTQYNAGNFLAPKGAQYGSGFGSSTLTQLQNTINTVSYSRTTPSDNYNIATYNPSRATANNTISINDVKISCNFDIKDTSGNIYWDNTTVTYPHFDNVTEIKQGYPDGVLISRGTYSENDTLYFHLLKITNTVVDNNNTIYYYSPKIFALNKNSKYYKTWDADTDNKYSYYFVDRSALSLDTNSSYLYVLSNSSESYTNSSGILQEDDTIGIYDVIESDTTGVITPQDSTNDKLQNLDDTLNDNTVSSDTETDIGNSLNFDNQNEGLNSLNGGFFSRLTTMLSNLLGYNLAEDTAVSLPVPNSNKSITLHSKDIYDHVIGAIRIIINAFWVYIFSFYMWKFINKVYIAVSTGNILDSFSSSGEAITNDML